MATTDQNYAGVPACQQGFGGTPELAREVFRDCMFHEFHPGSQSGLTLPTRSEREARLEKALRECDETLAALLDNGFEYHEARVMMHLTRQHIAEALKP